MHEVKRILAKRLAHNLKPGDLASYAQSWDQQKLNLNHEDGKDEDLAIMAARKESEPDAEHLPSCLRREENIQKEIKGRLSGARLHHQAGERARQ